jgi:hypothetical protein
MKKPTHAKKRKKVFWRFAIDERLKKCYKFVLSSSWRCAYTKKATKKQEHFYNDINK